MKKGDMIIAKDQFYSMDCHETQLNNNVLVVGASGSGKTRSIVSSNILQATGSYIISDPKGNLYEQFGDYLRSEGYDVKKVDFTNPKDSCGYNPIEYIRDQMDVHKVANILIKDDGQCYGKDPFWEDSAELLAQALLGYLTEFMPKERKEKRNLPTLLEMADLIYEDGDLELANTALDYLMDKAEADHPGNYVTKTYERFRVAADKTLRSILITFSAKLARFDSPELAKMLSRDTVDFKMLGQKKTALFVVVSDTDRSLDPLANMFFSQAMQELCRYADEECKDNALPVPVRFILDDFATNCKIVGFPRMIASIRSRNISTMLMIQSEAQLREGYNEDYRTIIGNCDTYVYLGGNDVETAKVVADRCDLPLKKILYMPVGTNWIFRRGQEPVNGVNFDIEPFKSQKMKKFHTESVR